VEIVPDYDVVFGQRYTQGAIVPEPGAGQALFAAHGSLSGLPGTRAPHRLFTHSGKQISTLDLFDRDLVLIVSPGSAWRVAAQPLSVERTSLQIVELDDLSPFGVENDGTVLVRPDGFVAWRSLTRPTDPVATLRNVCESLGFATPIA
jgi:putative polyketide hydroxylase